jgi:ubiquinone/menaquinone biosynthesis C-methylase UbiE
LTIFITDDKVLLMDQEKGQLFDQWPKAYDEWFTTPIGSLVKRYEAQLILDLLRPEGSEAILDAGCGTGIFSLDILSSGSKVIGVDISLPMLLRAGEKLKGFPFRMVLADMLYLPFPEGVFDKATSITALEFIRNAEVAVKELFRVTRKGGIIVVATLNSLSPWASKRIAEAKERHSIFERAIFRSPDDLRSLAPVKSIVKTAIHFQKEHDPEEAAEIERQGERKGLNTGAFVAIKWEKR